MTTSTAPFPPADLVGHTEEVDCSWTERDVLLYALGVGAGQADPAAEIELTTENSHGATLRTIPTFAGALALDIGLAGLAGADPAMVVHAEQGLRLVRPIPTAGRARLSSTVTGLYDKGSGALLVSETTATDLESDEEIFVSRSAGFVRGAGGFGGERGPAGEPWERPERVPDLTLKFAVRPDQALLYRLSGDRNPLHADPWFAARAGFPRPILHGLATYGIADRLLFNALADSDPNRMRYFSARFASPVLPGDTLEVRAWIDGVEVAFQAAAGADDRIVLDRGRMLLA